MASINNLNEVAHNALQKAELIHSLHDTMKAGIQDFELGNTGVKVFTSAVRDINLNFSEGNHAILTGKKDLDLQGNDKSNLLAANDGNNDIDAGGSNDQVATGAGNDRVWLGAGNDVIEVDGSGNKFISGGEGRDLFIVKSDDDLVTKGGAESNENTHVTISDFNPGDKLRIYADANKDGQIDYDDVESVVEEDGNTTFTLKDGTSFTLEGVTGATDGNITYEVSFDADGNPIVELS